MPVNGSLCNYYYVQPCAPGAGLNHTTAYFQSRKNTMRHRTPATTHFALHQPSQIKKQSGFTLCRKTEKLSRIITTALSCSTRQRGNIILHLDTCTIWVYCREQIRLCYRRQFLTHLILPAILWGHLRNQHPVCPTSQGAHQGQVAETRHTDRILCI